MLGSDTWPGGVAMESMTSMDSTGSCDSVVSVNSVFSDDSMEHLSPEERACLMFLEETIESLEAEEDSGLSTDEPEERLPVPGNMATKMEDLSFPVGQTVMDDVSMDPYYSMMEPVKDYKPSYLVPTPLVLANSSSSGLLKAGVGVEAETDSLPAPSTYLTDLPPDRVDLVHQPIGISPAFDPCQETPSEGNLLVIPPPTDFRDEPDAQVDLSRGSPPIPSQPKSDIVQQLLNRTVSKDEAKSPTANDGDQSHNGNNLPSPFEALPVSLHDFDEPKHSPPAVAPKPKRLPANIILKTQRSSISSPVSSPDPSTSSCTSPSDRILMDPLKVRMEALRKLGLLKDEDADLSPTCSPTQYSPNFRKSWQPSPSPVSPAFSDPPESDVPEAQSSPTLPPAMEAPVLKLLGEYRLRSSSDLPTVTRPSRTMGEKAATLERMGSGSSYLSMGQNSTSPDPPKTLIEDSLAKLRNTRPRPASLGNGKDFGAIQDDTSHTAASVTDVAKSPEAGDKQWHGSGSQKLPRSQGISVLITPHSKSGEDRREALRKLGLLKD